MGGGEGRRGREKKGGKKSGAWVKKSVNKSKTVSVNVTAVGFSPRHLYAKQLLRRIQWIAEIENPPATAAEQLTALCRVPDA